MAAFKVTDLLLGEKNFIDFVDKNLGQERDRLKSNELETDIVCSHLAGGVLDYPLMISHDFADITTAIDVYVDAFTRETTSKLPKPYAFGVFKPNTDKNERIAKMPFRGDELTVKQFINAILGACPKIRNHIIDCTDEVTKTGRLENLYIIISNVVMVRNYIWIFLEILEAENKPKLKVEYKEFCDLSEILCEQMLQIFGNLLTTFILHDEQSQNFSSHRAYYEGERGSPVIPVWAYFIRGMQREMWLKMPPQLAQRILAIIINDSLAILGARYSQIKPTEATSPQFVLDILNILTSIEEFLFFISPDLAGVCGQIDPSTSKILYSIHIKCHCLAASLIMVGCPLEVLYKTFRRGLSSCSLMDSRRKSLTKLTEPAWMSMLSFLCPKFYPTELDYNDWELLFNIKLLTAQAAPSWPLVYKVLTMNNCKISVFILSLFPTVVAPVTHFILEGHGFRRCKNASCMDEICHGLPKSIPNHLAASCTSYIVANSLPWDSLAKVYRPILPRITDWSVMDKTQIWNSQSRPVWFQSLIDIMLPVLKTCVQSVILSIADTVPAPAKPIVVGFVDNPTGKETLSKKTAATASKPLPVAAVVQKPKPSGSSTLDVKTEKEEEQITQWVIELLNTVTEILSIIPRGFFIVCEEMDDLIPRSFIPVRNNVPVHFLVTALYMLLQLGSSIINSIVEGDKPLNESKVSSAKGPKKATGKNKKEPSPVPSTTNHLEPYLFSIAERLCHLDDPVFDQVVHRLVTQVESMMKHTKTQHAKTMNQDEPTDFALELDVSHLKADFLMENIEGQLALRVMYWFLLTHGHMLEKVLTGEVNKESPKIEETKLSKKKHPSDPSFAGGDIASSSSPSGHNMQNANTLAVPKPTSMYQAVKTSMKLLKIAPRIKTSWKSINVIHDFHYVNKYRTFDEVIWNPRNLDWVQTVRHCRMGLHKAVIGKLLERRWEFKDFTEEPIDDKTRHLLKMVDEIKALILIT